MKFFRNKLSLPMVAALAVLALQSCSDTDSPGTGGVVPPDNSFYNFATYGGSSGEGSSFTVYREGDAGSATITFSQSFTAEQLKAGSRVFMSYTTLSGQPYTSGPGTLYSLQNVTGGKTVPATGINRVRTSTPVKMTEMKRTGDYLNMVFQVPSSGQLMKLELTEAANLKDPEYPMLGLFVKTDNEMGAYRYARVSFDVTDVLAPADVKGFKVEYFGDRGIDTLTFVKSGGAGTITPIG